MATLGCNQSQPPARETAPATPPASTLPADNGEEWIVSDRGVGTIAIGERSEALQGRVDQLGKVGECVYGNVKGREGILIMMVDGVVKRVDVTNAATATSLGARVGDSEAQVKKLYPSLRVEPHKYVSGGHYLVVDGGGQRRLVFETDGKNVTRYRAGASPQVDWVEGCS